ncbi:galactose oxidase [Micractinium conductrix]|uniref:Galactose oxidase n=1 Tax=Micractinium conductrix TaxID=554055 RepID=A0A2P6VIF0_9CHLO|nr:galactose oxidase [Micractinium conductrix]|eukprot:PSC73864.1 galactose oxidase [Micractinium conductrix]
MCCGRLRPFLERRPQLCILSDDGRQHVNLTPAGINLGGGTPGHGGAAALLPSPLASLGAGKLPGAGGGAAGAAATSDQVAAAVMPGVAAAQSAAKDYKKWDALTKEIFQYVRAKGVATFNQIDAHVKASPYCAKQIAATGIPLHQWRSQFFLHKRRNIFRLQGPVVSLSSYVPDAPDESASEASSSAAAGPEEFPPLPGSSSATPTAAAAPAAAPAASGSGGGSTPVAAAAPAAAPAGNPLLAAFAAERQQMEALRDDVQSKLASFKALSELQKENAGLRAACVTLGRELLSLKSEFTAFQQQTQAALGALSSGGGAGSSPGVIAAAGGAATPPGPPSLSAMLQQQVTAAASPVAEPQPAAASPSGPQQLAAAAPTNNTPSGVQELQAMQAALSAVPEPSAPAVTSMPPLPLHTPATAPLVAAPAPPATPMHPGELVLVGGHDGGAWLDSVDFFSPLQCMWASLPQLGKPRSFCAAVATASEVFVVSGGNGVEWFDSVARYDRAAGLMGGWTELAPLQVARGSLSAGLAGGYLFAYGGGKPNEQYNVVEWYDPQSNRWLPGPPLQKKRFALGGASLGGALYAVGGFDGSSYLQCAERLDPRTDRWEVLPCSMVSQRGGHAVSAAGDTLYEPAGPPPGLSSFKPPAASSAPPPLEPPPPPLVAAAPAAANGPAPPAPAAAPRPSTAPAARPPTPQASTEEIRAAVVDYLKNKPSQKDLLNRLGVYLRSRRLAPEGQLKKFLQQHCQGRVVLRDTQPGVGADVVQLAEAAAAERSAALERAAAAGTPPPPRIHAPPPERPTSSGGASADTSFDPSWMEQKLMEHCVEIQCSGGQPALPGLGQFCIEKLGMQMRGRLRPFLERRPQLCILSDDGRQHVNLTPAGINLGGGTPGHGGAAALLPSPLASLGAGKLPGAGGGAAGAAATSDQVAAAVMPGVAAAQSAAKDYKKWDALTKEIFQYVRAKGVATFNQIDAHVKASPYCAKQIAATGIPLHQWRSQFFLHKRRNIFRLQGPVVSLSSYVPDAPDESASEASSSAAAGPEEFPPLPGSSSATPTAAAAPAAAPAASGSGGGSTPVAAAAPAAAPAGNPLLAAFAAERQQMEALRDDVQSKLASFKALSELQKENAGLRAACVTLGRELLSLKSEFTAFQQQTQAALGALSSGGGAGSSPGVIAAAGGAATPPGPPSLSAMLQQQVTAAASPVAEPQPAAASPSGPQQLAAAAPTNNTPSGVQELQAMQAALSAVPEPSAPAVTSMPPLPLHTPATAPLVAAPAPPATPMHPGELVLVGGHDGGAWLDSVDFFSPLQCMWASLPQLGKPRSFCAAVATASEVFVVGGGNGVEWFDSVARYDRAAGLMGGWTELAPLQVARGSLSAGLAGGYLFAYGGGKPNEQYNVVEWYDPQSNRWLPGPPLQKKRFALGGASLGGALYAVGGFDGSSYLQCAERLDPRTDRWEVLPCSMVSQRGGHAVSAAGDTLYVIGGFDGVQAMPSCELFEPRTNTWRAIADMGDSRAYGSSATLGSTVFAVGGLQSDMQTHAVLIERYDAAADSWQHVELPSNANPRRSFLAACGLE